MTRRTKSLVLATETLRSLSSSDLGHAAGGAPAFHGSFGVGSLRFGEAVAKPAVYPPFRGSFSVGSLRPAP